jgi:hypothetical protein
LLHGQWDFPERGYYHQAGKIEISETPYPPQKAWNDLDIDQRSSGLIILPDPVGSTSQIASHDDRR